MLFPSWLRGLRVTVDSMQGRLAWKCTRRGEARRRPFVEWLEDRTLPSTATWTSSISGDWNNAANWSIDGVPDVRTPGAADDVIINNPGIVITDNAATPHPVNSLTLEAGTLTDNDNLTINSFFTWTGGTLAGNGTTIIEPSATLNVGTSSIYTNLILDGHTLDIKGSAYMNSQVPDNETVLTMSDDATLNNEGTFTIGGYDLIDLGTGNAPAIVNTGTLVDNATVAGRRTSVFPYFNNQGTISLLQNGEMYFDQGISTGSITAGGGTILDLNNFTIASSGTLASSGHVGLDTSNGLSTTVAGSYDVTGDTEIAGTVYAPGIVSSVGSTFYDHGYANWYGNSITTTTFDLGNSVGPGQFVSQAPVTVTGNMTWTDGLISGTGAVTITSSATLLLTNPRGGNSFFFLNGRALDNQGTAALQGDASIDRYEMFMWNGAQITNEGAFAVDSYTFAFNSGNPDVTPGPGLTPTFINNSTGTFTKTNSTGDASFDDVPFVNNGAVHVTAGSRLTFYGGATGGGIYSVDAGALLDCANLPGINVTYVFGPNGSFTGQGTVEFDVPATIAATYAVSGSTSIDSTVTIATNVTMAGEWTINGTLVVNGGSTLTDPAATVLGTPSNGATLDIENGTLNAWGTINANVYNAGVVNVGGSGTTSALTVNGNFTQDSNGTTNWDIEGTSAVTQFDQLSITGTASFDGVANFTLINGYIPSPGSYFPVLPAPNLVNFSAVINGLALPNGGSMVPGYINGVGFLAVPDTTTTSATASALTVGFGQAVTLNATVSANNPTPLALGGTVDFFDTTTQTDLGSVSLSSSGTASLSPDTPLSLGTHSIKISYSGTPFFLSSYTTITVNVVPDIYILDPKASGSLALSGNGSINIPGIVYVDSSSKTALTATGNAKITANSIQVVGNVQVSGNASLSPAASTGVASIPNPLASLTGPSTAGLTSFGSVSYSGNGSYTLNPGIYKQISISGKASVTLNPGLYLIEGGGVTVSGNASLTGTNFMIYNTSSNYPLATGSYGGITLSGNGTFSLTAPTTNANGVDAGIVIFQPTANTRAISLSGNAANGLTGTLYAPAALLSMSGNAKVSGSLVVDQLSESGNASSTVTVDGGGSSAGTAGQLLAGNLLVYVNDPNNLLTADELARIQDAVNAVNAVVAPYGESVAETTDSTVANVTVDTGSTSAGGGFADGVLGCYTSAGEITLIQGWNWYAGSDATAIGSAQYDFETAVVHELGHALGLGHNSDPTSVMHATLANGASERVMTVADLAIPDAAAGADALHAAPSVTSQAANEIRTMAAFAGLADLVRQESVSRDVAPKATPFSEQASGLAVQAAATVGANIGNSSDGNVVSAPSTTGANVAINQTMDEWVPYCMNDGAWPVAPGEAPAGDPPARQADPAPLPTVVPERLDGDLRSMTPSGNEVDMEMRCRVCDALFTDDDWTPPSATIVAGSVFAVALAANPMLVGDLLRGSERRKWTMSVS
jgi:hypothetical protein